MSNIDESKLIFYTGAPGSKWSATAHIITYNKIYPINTSDYLEERTHYHNTTGVSHLGAYWGPGNGVGENFHNFNKLSKEEIIEEINNAYSDKTWNKYRLVKCHHFSLHLDYIKETFPQSKIIIVMRPFQQCITGWLGSGGFEKIKYPNYTEYYKDKETIKTRIEEESHLARDFIQRNNLDIFTIREQYWSDFWGISRNSKELNTYMRSIEMRQVPHKKATWALDTVISHYNF